MRLALTIAYDGSAFYGSAYQPRLRTVEGDLASCLADMGVIERTAGGVVHLASRTDRGVSAAGNVCAFDSSLGPESLLPGLVHTLEDIWVTGAAVVDDRFHPRHAASKTYRYYLPQQGLEVESMRQAAQIFVGQHDFSAFAKLDGRNPERTVTDVGVEQRDGLLVIEVTGTSFLWNQVRRMVAAVAAAGRGDITPEEMAQMLAGASCRDPGIASPEYLLLARVSYRPAIAWQPVSGSARFLERRVADMAARHALFVDMHTLATGATSK
ncbi:MAG TPA: tRNA pseudouridine(38-40) synthase TruA [Thermoplasmatales archaeon]|nr:tRNA pseudouridine(38-40) synthase TruA [Thermoplasmatales archaeon]